MKHEGRELTKGQKTLGLEVKKRERKRHKKQGLF